MYNYDIGGQERKIEVSEGIADIPQNRTLLIEKLTDDPELRKLIEAEAQYPKELEAPYEGAEQTLRTLSSRYILLPA